MNLSVKKASKEHIPFIFHVFEQNRAILHGSYIPLDEWTDYFASSDTTGGNDPYESHHIINPIQAVCLPIRFAGLYAITPK